MNIKQQLLRDEGMRLQPYTDTVGKLTIGVGRNLTDNGISQEEAMVLLENDINAADIRLRAAIPWTQGLDDARYGALLNMAFNMGVGGLLSFRNTLAAIEHGKWDEAADGMLDSKWAQQVGARAQRLALQVRTGEWQ